LQGSAHGDELAGPAFLNEWGNRTIADLFTVSLETMSGDMPDALKESANLDIIAYILQANGAVAGDGALQADSSQVIGVAIRGDQWEAAMAKAAPLGFDNWDDAGSIAEAARNASGFVNKTVTDYSPVTTEMLADPPAGDWLQWRRTADGHGYSPLGKVDRENVGKLKLSWVLTMREGSNQVTPLVHDGIMYLTHPQNVIQALDAATGELI
jgi:alcohol dehydrogenase (cytochrome c)